jgi:SAM-dependent methyltransferase
VHLINTCDLCGENKFLTLVRRIIQAKEPWVSFIHLKNFPFTIQILLCRTCGWIFQSPAYDDEEVERLYNSKSAKQNQYNDSLKMEQKKRGDLIFSLVSPYVRRSPLQKPTVLDVGGGKAELMGAFVDHGYQATVLDLSVDSPCYAEVSKIRSSFLDWNGGPYDIIIMSHTLEHTQNPSAFLNHAKHLLVDEGILFVEVPFELLTPFVVRSVGDYRHLGYFTSTTLRNYLEKSGLHCLLCFHTAGVIGNTIPLIRALATKYPSHSQETRWQRPRRIVLKSLAELLRPMPWIYRIRNKLSRGLGISS